MINEQPDTMSERHTLLLRLAGPMQSWGFRSRFDNRDTALEPTRSGVIGLLCAAQGIGREGDLEQFAALKMGVRVDVPGRVMVDYHTAQSVLRANGDVAETMQSWRYYLSDARFLVGLESDDRNLLQRIEAALRNPVWPLSLGRRSFVPSLSIPLYPTGLRLSRNLVDTLSTEPWYRVQKREKKPALLRLLVETTSPDEGAAMGDVPLNFKARRFGLRFVQSLAPVKSESIEEEECISLNSY